jgi:DNA-binding transcriptional MerR regulator
MRPTSPRPEPASELLTTGDSATLIEQLTGRPCSADTVIYYERTGRLASTRTRSGLRLFLAAHVRDLAQAIEAKRSRKRAR